MTHHPDGHQELIRDRSPLREKLASRRDRNKHHHGKIHQEHLRRIEWKHHKQRTKGLPSEKSPI